MTAPSQAVFLSYASQDSAASRRIAEALRAGGVEVWLDTTELRGGDAWDQKIKKQIRDCALFLPIISATTQERDEGYFRREWKQAVDRTHDMAGRAAFLLPVVIDATNERDAEVPDEFRNVQWTRLPNGETPPAFVERVRGLLDAKSARIDSTRPIGTPASSSAPAVPPAAPPPVASPPSSSPSASAPVASAAPRRFSPALLAAVIIAALAIGYITWQQFRIRRPEVAAAVTPATPSAATTTAPAAAEQSVAVLPFVNESSDKEQEYFADGLTDTMIDLLSKVPDLRVPARSSSFFFKGKNEELSAIGSKLHVSHVLEGTVRKAGNRLRVSAELIRVDTGFHAWSETYDRDAKDIFKVQDEISAAVVAALKLKLVAAGTNTKVRGTVNPEAYNQLLIANHLMRELPSADIYRRAGEALRKALALDPAYADASAKLVLADAYLADFTGDSAALQRAIAAAEHLPLAHPDHGPSYRIRADIRSSWNWNWSGAEADYEKALALDPTDADAYFDESIQLQGLGRFGEAITTAQKSIALDGLNVAYLGNLSAAQMALRDYAAAAQSISRMAEIDPQSDVTASTESVLRLLQGRYADSLRECPKIADERTRLACVARAQHSLGSRAEADLALADLLKTGTGGNLTNIAGVYAWFGDADQAFAWFDKAAAARESGVIAILPDRTLDGLHKDPRWTALLKKLNLPE
jgi:TolB-like protein